MQVLRGEPRPRRGMRMFIRYNANPSGKSTIDCTVRAISKASRKGWREVYSGICAEGYKAFDMPSSNAVWGAYLRRNGFRRHIIPDTCPDCYTIIDFCEEHPEGTYILATGSHVVAVKDGNYYDTWDSGSETPIYYFQKEN